MSSADALAIAVSTWGNVKPVVHYSQSRAVEQNIKCPAQAHSDSYWETMDIHGHDVDIMLEAKFKEIALFKYRDLLTNKIAA
jgi:UV DNA damage repair endonuclease